MDTQPEIAPEARRQPVQERAIRKRKKVITGALETLSEVGAVKLNMREVAKRAEVGLGTVYDYFPSRSDLLAEVATDWFETRLNVLDSAMNQTPENGNFHTFITIYRQAMKSKGFWSALDKEIHAAARQDDKVAAILETYRNQMALRISRILTDLGSTWERQYLVPLSRYILHLVDQLEPDAGFAGNAAELKIVRQLITQSIAASIKIALNPFEPSDAK
jgi:AcrR family transcriptional regulator